MVLNTFMFILSEFVVNLMSVNNAYQLSNSIFYLCHRIGRISTRSILAVWLLLFLLLSMLLSVLLL